MMQDDSDDDDISFEDFLDGFSDMRILPILDITGSFLNPAGSRDKCWVNICMGR